MASVENKLTEALNGNRYHKFFNSEVLSKKVLLVGAGGIGCEVLKNLVLSGFKDIEIIDLDTIDISNLNRQFLFQREHVGKSKAVVARETALKFNPDVTIKAYHDTIIRSEYGTSFFEQFAVVINALDNRKARNHVNRLCLAAAVPLIETGTSGYEGQVELIKGGLTQCYECLPKTAQKTYPGCTIRNTPSEPVHCIVWAKHLFNQLFGEEDPDQDVSPDSADPDAADPIPANPAAAGDTAEEKPALLKFNEAGNVERVSTRAWARGCQYQPDKLFSKFFHDDIHYLLSMGNLWKTRTPPVPLDWDNLPDAIAGGSKEPTAEGLKDQRIWSVAECGRVFADSCKHLRAQLEALDEKDHLVWDKDDETAMDFVAACSNIRSHIFNIPQMSRFDVKSIAGNIIPAIATTNAVVAGVATLHAMSALRGEFENCNTVYLRSKPNHMRRLLMAESGLNPPQPSCYVCASKPKVSVQLDVNVMTLYTFEEQVLKRDLNLAAPDVILDSGGIVLSSEEGETEANLPKTLSALGIVDGSILTVDDFLQNYNLTIIIRQRLVPKDGPEFVISGDTGNPQPTSEEPNANGKGESSKDNEGVCSDDDDIMEMVLTGEDSVKQSWDSSPRPGEKRKTAAEDVEAKPSKKLRQEDEDDCVVME